MRDNIDWVKINNELMVAEATVQYKIRKIIVTDRYSFYSTYAGLEYIGGFRTQLEAIEACKEYEKRI